MKSSKKKLVDRYDLGEVPKRGIWYKYGDWSVMNCGELMKTHPMPSGVEYTGWEAMRGNEQIRRETLDELIKNLTPINK